MVERGDSASGFSIAQVLACRDYLSGLHEIDLPSEILVIHEGVAHWISAREGNVCYKKILLDRTGLPFPELSNPKLDELRESFGFLGMVTEELLVLVFDEETWNKVLDEPMERGNVGDNLYMCKRGDPPLTMTMYIARIKQEELAD